MSSSPYFTCVICSSTYNKTEEGHNPFPIKDTGLCCSKCNLNTVVTARLGYHIVQGAVPTYDYINTLTSDQINYQLIQQGSRTSGTLDARRERLRRFIEFKNRPRNWEVVKAEEKRKKEAAEALIELKNSEENEIKINIFKNKSDSVHTTFGRKSNLNFKEPKDIIHIVNSENQQNEEEHCHDCDIGDIKKDIKSIKEHSESVTRFSSVTLEKIKNVYDKLIEHEDRLGEHESSIRMVNEKLRTHVDGGGIYDTLQLALRDIQNLFGLFRSLKKQIDDISASVSGTTENILEVSTIDSTDQLNTAIPSMNYNDHKSDEGC